MKTIRYWFGKDEEEAFDYTVDKHEAMEKIRQYLSDADKNELVDMILDIVSYSDLFDYYAEWLEIDFRDDALESFNTQLPF